MNILKALGGLFVFAMLPLISHSQTTVEVRVSMIYSDICDTDSGFGEGNSDPKWLATADDGQGNTGSFDHEIPGTNSPGHINFIQVFFSHTYTSSPPNSIALTWRAYEEDASEPHDEDTGEINTSIDINYMGSSMTWGNTNTQERTLLGGECGSATWRIAFQVRYETVLPVKFIHFDGFWTDQEEAKLEWETASEKNNEGFYVQHSLDGKEFNNLGFVPTALPNGTGSSISEYSFMAASGTGYYRLKQVDFDGAFEYSKMIFLGDNKLGYEPSVFPNPFEDSIGIKGLNQYEEGSIELYSLDGTLILEREITNTQPKLTGLDKLNTGIYYLKINSKGKEWIQRLVKK